MAQLMLNLQNSTCGMQAWVGEDTFVLGSKSNDLCMVNLRSKKVSRVPLPKRVVNEWEVSCVETSKSIP